MMNYLQYLVEKIHTAIIATVDTTGMPYTCAIDIMDYDAQGLYFLTAKGKGFYQRLMANPHIALTALKGEDTMSSVAISLQGEVRELGGERVAALFEKNPYMYAIYPTEESRVALTVFQIYKGQGEWFDLSKKPIERDVFTLGQVEKVVTGYEVTAACIGCKACYSKCPQKCIDVSVKPVVIKQANCLHCGNCFEICPVKAIVKH